LFSCSAIQGDTITSQPQDVARLAPPLLTYFAVMWVVGFAIAKLIRLPYAQSASLGFTVASNDFELAIGVCVGVWGATSGRALTGVVGPLIEVPVLVGLVYVALCARRFCGRATRPPGSQACHRLTSSLLRIRGHADACGGPIGDRCYRGPPVSSTHPPAATHDPHQLPRLGRRGGGWVAVQMILLVAIFLSALTGLGWLHTFEPIAYAVGSALILVGVALLAAGGVGLGRALTPFPAPRDNAQLETGGVYRLVRHPMYGGGILIALGWSAIFATPVGLALTVVLGVFAELKARREESWLEQTHPGYADYRRRTGHKFIPFVW
jgi:protein-S-isoprenylcysteine O-methyltransferase Ste14